MTTDIAIAVVVALSLGGAVAVWLGLPLLRGDRPEAPPDARVLALLSEREAVLSGIRDLDADRSLGRIGAEAYAERRSELTGRGVAILAMLDQIDQAAGVAMGALAGQIEADVASRDSPEGRAP